MAVAFDAYDLQRQQVAFTRNFSRVADAPGLLRACVGKPDLSAKASLEPIESFDALVSGLIQVIRSALFDFRPGARNVWLLSLTDMALPLDTSPFANGAEVTLTLEGTRRRGDRNVIIEQIVLEGAGAPPVTLRMMCSWEGDFEGS